MAALRPEAVAALRLFGFALDRRPREGTDGPGARAMARLAKNTMQEVGRATERTRRDSIKHLESTEVFQQEGTLVGESSQEPRDAGQPQSEQGPRPPQQLLEAGVAGAAFAAPYSQFGPDFFNEYDGAAEIFGNFDPSFDLGRTDAIFSANLDLSVPYFAED